MFEAPHEASNRASIPNAAELKPVVWLEVPIMLSVLSPVFVSFVLALEATPALARPAPSSMQFVTLTPTDLAPGKKRCMRLLSTRWPHVLVERPHRATSCLTCCHCQ